MKKYILLLLILITVVSAQSQETSKINTEDPYNYPTFGFETKVERNVGGQPTEIDLNKTFSIKSGDKLKIKVIQGDSELPINQINKKWQLVVVFYNSNVTHSINRHVFFKDLMVDSLYAREHVFTAPSLTVTGSSPTSLQFVPIVFLVTDSNYVNQLVNFINTTDGKNAVGKLSDGLGKFSKVLSKVDSFLAMAQTFLAQDNLSEISRENRLNRIARSFKITLPKECESEVFKAESQKISNYELSKKRIDCFTQKMDLTQININSLATRENFAELVGNELLAQFPALLKYLPEIRLAIAGIRLVISLFRKELPPLEFATSVFVNSKSQYKLKTQTNIIGTDSEFAVTFTPQLSFDTNPASLNLPSEIKTPGGRKCFAPGENIFRISETEFLTKEPIDFYLETGGRQIPLQKDEINSYLILDVAKEDFSQLITNGKLTGKIIARYGFDEKISSGEFSIAAPSEVKWSIVSTQVFTKGENGKIQLKVTEGSSDCLQSISFTDRAGKTETVTREKLSFKSGGIVELNLDPQNFSTGKGKLRFQHIGEIVEDTEDLVLHKELPRISGFRIHPAENCGVLEGTGAEDIGSSSVSGATFTGEIFNSPRQQNQKSKINQNMNYPQNAPSIQPVEMTKRGENKLCFEGTPFNENSFGNRYLRLPTKDGREVTGKIERLPKRPEINSIKLQFNKSGLTEFVDLTEKNLIPLSVDRFKLEFKVANLSSFTSNRYSVWIKKLNLGGFSSDVDFPFEADGIRLENPRFTTGKIIFENISLAGLKTDLDLTEGDRLMILFKDNESQIVSKWTEITTSVYLPKVSAAVCAEGKCRLTGTGFEYVKGISIDGTNWIERENGETKLSVNEENTEIAELPQINQNTLFIKLLAGDAADENGEPADKIVQIKLPAQP